MKIRKSVISGHTAMASDTSGVLDISDFDTVERITIYTKYSGVGGGQDGSIKIYLSDETSDNIANGKVLSDTITTSSASNLTDCTATVISAGCDTVQVVYTANANTGTGTLEVHAIVEYQG